jgi:hypothetical protein
MRTLPLTIDSCLGHRRSVSGGCRKFRGSKSDLIVRGVEYTVETFKERVAINEIETLSTVRTELRV